jgi:hypothetical protein
MLAKEHVVKTRATISAIVGTKTRLTMRRRMLKSRRRTPVMPTETPTK